MTATATAMAGEGWHRLAQIGTYHELGAGRVTRDCCSAMLEAILTCSDFCVSHFVSELDLAIEASASLSCRRG
jgi:hypothetical protein